MDRYNDQIMDAILKESKLAKATDKNFDNTYLKNLPLAMAYVPFQRWREVYDPCKALSRGTIFPELDLPWYGRELFRHDW